MGKARRRKRAARQRPEPLAADLAWPKWWIAVYAFVAVVVIGIYARAVTFGFITMDDFLYVSGNEHVMNGLTADSIRWAFTGYGAGNWHPITWLSLMLDYSLSGLNPVSYHATNIALHTAATLLLMLAMVRLTGSIWRATFVAALFGVHPVHVESVAWISERKDVLSAFFFMLTLLAYIRYERKRESTCYVLMLILYACGLMAKPMLVSLPIVLLLLDIWPLKRTKESWLALIREKLPLLFMSAVSCWITIYVQGISGAVGTLDRYPVLVRIANAAVSYVAYLSKMIYPIGLAAYYPHPGASVVSWKAAAALVGLIVVTWLVLCERLKRPFLAVGWLWYMVTLIPVIGLVQVADQAMADRYTYLPSIGFFIMLAWGLPELCKDGVICRGILGVVGGIAFVLLSIISYIQIGTWRSNITVWDHAVRVTSNNALAHHNLAHSLVEAHRLDEAIVHYRVAIKIKPDKYESYNNLGHVYLMRNELDRAESLLDKALRTMPNYPEAIVNMGFLREKQGMWREAMRYFAKGYQLKPSIIEAKAGLSRSRVNLAIEYAKAGNRREAISLLQEGIQFDPGDLSARYNLAIALDAEGRQEEAIAEYEEIIRHKPNDPGAHNNLGAILAQRGRLDEAIEHFKAAVKSEPTNRMYVNNLNRHLWLRAQLTGKKP